MNFACFVSFMTFQFFLNLAFHANICPIRTLMVMHLIFFQNNSKMCASQHAQTEHFQNKASQPTFS